MNKYTLLIGAGGVSSYLVPAWRKTFPDGKLVIMDGDKLEKRNLDRQLFDESDIGKYKAAALADKYDCLAINDYFEPSKFVEPADVNRIVCAVDNHSARREAISFSHAYRSWAIPSFIGANEYWTSQAFVFHPSLNAMYRELTPWPLFKYPEIANDKSRDPTNPSCVELKESDPQLAGVNMITASLIMQLVLRWESFDIRDVDIDGDVEKVHGYLPTEFQTTFGATQTQQLRDHDQIEKPKRQEVPYQETDELLFI